MIENESYVAVKMGSERGFGLVFATLFAVIALFPLIGSGRPNLPASIVAVALALIAWRAPRLLATPNRLWFRFGLALGHVVGTVVMVLVYLVVVVPTGLLMRAVGKDPLQTRLRADATTYWKVRESEPGSMKDQF